MSILEKLRHHFDNAENGLNPWVRVNFLDLGVAIQELERLQAENTRLRREAEDGSTTLEAREGNDGCGSYYGCASACCPARRETAT